MCAGGWHMFWWHPWLCPDQFLHSQCVIGEILLQYWPHVDASGTWIANCWQNRQLAVFGWLCDEYVILEVLALRRMYYGYRWGWWLQELLSTQPAFDSQSCAASPYLGLWCSSSSGFPSCPGDHYPTYHDLCILLPKAGLRPSVSGSQHTECM